MSIKAGVVIWVIGAIVAGSIAFAAVRTTRSADCLPGSAPTGSPAISAHAGHGDGHGLEGGVSVGPTCNVVETAAPHDSVYRPDVPGASRDDRVRARRLLAGVNRFCRTSSAAEIMGEWVPGGTGLGTPTHFFNPHRRRSFGLDPSDPRAVLVYRGEIGGVMFTGMPLPALGSIPRAHSHDASGVREMLHVYCTTDLADAFTPDRQLGVLRDDIALRRRTRPLVAGLTDPRLGTVLRTVRGYAGDELVPVDPRTFAASGLGDPLLRAAREEVRRSLVLLTERELRAVLSLVEGR